MFKSFWGSQDQQSQSGSQDVRTQQSWYPPSASNASTSSRPSTPGSSSSSFLSSPQRASDGRQSPSYGPLPPAEAAELIAGLRDKSMDELRKILNDRNAYITFLNSLEQVKIQANLWDELRKETLQLASKNLEKETRTSELKNQCRIIRTTELAAAYEKLNELERRKDEILKKYAPSSLVRQLHDSTVKIDEESEYLHNQLLNKEIDLTTFLQKSKQLRTMHHRRALLHLAVKTSVVS